MSERSGNPRPLKGSGDTARSGNPRALKGSGDTNRSGNPRLLRQETEPERVPSGSFEPFGVNPNGRPDRKNWSNLCRTVWALINNPDLIVGRDNSRIRWPEIPIPGSGGTGGGSSSSSSSSDSSSSSGSSESSSSGSSESSAGSSAGSAGSDSGSDKSTAIVPLGDGYTALFCMEAPQVLFHDFIEARTNGRTTLVRIDPRFLAVCEPGTVRVAAVCPDLPVTLGARMDAAGVVLTKHWWSPDAVVMIQLVGIRRGFLGKRFPRRSREQFEANEAFINSAYPGTPSPPQA